MKTLSSILVGLSAIVPLLVLQYEGKTNLGANWEQNRVLMETRMKLNHTNMLTGSFEAPSYQGNVNALNYYTDSLKAAKAR